MEWELTTKIFDNYRGSNKEKDLADEENIRHIKNVCLQWNKTGPGFGIQIKTIDNKIHQGLAWYIFPDKNKIRYYLEEYQEDKVIINHYEILFEYIIYIKYLGKTNTIRPWINQPLFNHHQTLEVKWKY